MNLRLGASRFVFGCSAGLNEPTAVVDVVVSGDGEIDLDIDAQSAARIRDGLRSLRPPDDFDWPERVLDDGGSRLGYWLVTVMVAVQQWSGDPVWQGRVLRAEPGLLRLAVPWWRERLASATQRVALELVRAWIDGIAVPVAEVRAEFDQARRDGLSPTTLLLAAAARRRDMPAGVLAHCVQFGWGADAVRFDLTLTDRTSWMAIALLKNATKSRHLLNSARIPVSEGGDGGDDHLLLVAGGRMLAAVRGEATVDVTADVHPNNAALAVRAARTIGLDVAGVEMVATDISRGRPEADATVREVRVQADLTPFRRVPDIGDRILDAITGDRTGRIPTAAITGTNGKSTTSEMLHRIWTAAGKVTGVCTTAHVRIGGDIVSVENLSGYPGTKIILDDPAVQAAVLEMPRKGLILFGHACDRYDVAALLNVQDDHLGEFGIDTLEQMAELKAEVLQRATGAVVVNADDPLCMAMLARAGTDRHILVTEHPASVAGHRRDGGEAVLIAEHDGRPWIMLCAGQTQTPLIPVHEIPATMNGLLRFNAINAMFAAALAWAQGIDPATIRRALGSFHNSVRENPGRYNFIEGFPFPVLLDFAHNPDGVRGVCEVAAGLPVSGRRILCTRGIGSRGVDQFASVAADFARNFDQLVLGCIPQYVLEAADYVGPDPVAAMLSATRQCLLDEGVSANSVICSADPAESIRTALSLAGPGDLVVILAKADSALPIIEECRRSS